MIILGVSFGTVISWIGYVLVALLCLMAMIVIHELGHYVAGKMFHFTITEFSIGFGPAIFRRNIRRTGEAFSIRCIPLGGFCAFEGEDENSHNEGDFNSKPVWQRIIVLGMGAMFNYLSALLIVSIFFMSYGELVPQVVRVYPFHDDACVQLLEEGDVILSVNNEPTYSLLEANKFQQLLADKEEVVLTIERDGQQRDLTVRKGEYTYAVEDENGEIKTYDSVGFGISVGYAKRKLPFFSAIGHGFEFGLDLVRFTFRAIGSVFTGKASVGDTLGGTVTAIHSLATLSSQGFAAVMYGLCVLSMSLAMFNILPIPALDGARILFCVIEGIFNKPINRRVEGAIHTVGLVVLFGLAILLDIVHFFKLGGA